MHPEALAYVAGIVGDARPARVLEFGSRNINGTVRDLFPASEFTGVDRTAGPGVDVVADAAGWTGGGFDMVVCCEVLEHTRHGGRIVKAARRALNPGGVLIVTCATDPRGAHSAHDGGRLRDGEFYRNVSPRMMTRWLADAGLHTIDQQIHADRGDLYVTASP